MKCVAIKFATQKCAKFHMFLAAAYESASENHAVKLTEAFLSLSCILLNSQVQCKCAFRSFKQSKPNIEIYIGSDEQVNFPLEFFRIFSDENLPLQKRR